MCSKPACMAPLCLTGWRTSCSAQHSAGGVQLQGEGHSTAVGERWGANMVCAPRRAPEQCAAIRGRLCCV